MWKLANFEKPNFFPKVLCQSSTTHTLKQSLFTIPKLVNNNKLLCILASTGICILIGLGYYIRYKRKKKPKPLLIHSNQLMRSGVWKSLQFASVSTPIIPITDFASLTTDQLFENGVVSFHQAVTSWRTCCELMTSQQAEAGFDPREDCEVSDATIHGPNSVSERRVRTLLLQADYMCQCIDRVRVYSSANGVGEYSAKMSDSGSDVEFRGIWNPNSPKSSIPFPETSSDISDDNDRTLEILSQSTDSFESAIRSEDNFTPIPKHPTIIIQSNNLYNQAIQLATNNQIFVRKYRTEMLYCKNDIDFTAKLHCIRNAFDLLIETQENRLFFDTQTREMMTRFLTRANKDPIAFSTELTAMIDYVNIPDNFPAITKELNDRNLKIVGFWDVAIDFALLDAFTDLENLPTPVTMVTQNRWLTPGLRESALTSAVWAVMQGKIKMLENKNGFMSHFYKLGETFMFSFAWGFLGTDEELKELCCILKEGILLYLRDLFDLQVANYSTIDTLSEDVIRIGRERLNVLNSNL